MKYKKIDKKSYNMHLIKTDRFKMTTVRVILRDEIRKEEITKRNFLLDMLTYSTYNYKTRKELVAKSQDLYATNIYTRAYRTGRNSNINFYLSFLNEKYTEEKMTNESIKLLSEVIFNPNVINNSFDKESFDIIKRNTKVMLNSEKDNPARYSMTRMLENMGEGREYSYRESGYLEDLEKITPENLYEYYKEIITKSTVDIYVIGNFGFDDMEQMIDENMEFNTIKRKKKDYIIEHEKLRKTPKVAEEKEDYNQSKLSIGCKIEKLDKRERNYVISLYNLILGSGPECRFFKNIREKHSICYYVSSSINKLDNLLLIRSGIQKDNFKKCVDLIKKEMKDIEKGNISDEEIEKAKQTYCTLMDEIYDSADAIIETYIAKDLLDIEEIEERKEIIKTVTKEEIINVSKKVHIDTIYLLEGVNEDGEN